MIGGPKGGKWEFKRCPFGLTQAPAYFQMLVNKVLEGLEFSFGYLDDILIYMSWLRACRPVIPGVPRVITRVIPVWYASGCTATRSVMVMNTISTFGQACALTSPKGGRPCSLDTRYYLVASHLAFRLRNY